MAATSPAHATAVAPDTWYSFGFSGNGTALISGAGVTTPTNPVALEVPEPAWTFLLTEPGEVTFLGLFISSDQFALFDFGSSIGVTSAPTDGGACGSDITCAPNDPGYSRGVFQLAAGSHSLTGLQTLGESGAGAFMASSSIHSDVPLPAGLGFQGVIAALGLGAAWLRRRRAA